jgi:hypothetical protein
MGGPGSGNHYHWWRSAKKTVVEECLRIDADRWTREGILKAGVHQTGSWVWTYGDGGTFRVNYEAVTLDLARPLLRLWYSWVWRSTGKEDSAGYHVRLTTTEPRFGGLRWWFVCPLVVDGMACGRRVGKLYLPPLGRYFGCRRCYDLSYTSCQESHKYDCLFRILARTSGMDFETVKWAMGQIEKRE